MDKPFDQSMYLIEPSETEALLAQEAKSQLVGMLKKETEYHLQLLQGDEPGRTFDIPASAMQLLLQVLDEIGQGNAVTLSSTRTELTSKQAADMLNVSRPYLVQLLEKGEIPFRKVGTHRRVKLQDLLVYKNAIEAKRYETLNDLTAYEQELGLQ